MPDRREQGRDLPERGDGDAAETDAGSKEEISGPVPARDVRPRRHGAPGTGSHRDSRPGRRKLAWFLFFRVVTLTLILAAVVVVAAVTKTLGSLPSHHGKIAFGLIALAYTVSILAGLLSRSGSVSTVGLVYGILATDFLAATEAVLLTGGAGSGLTVLYLMLILAAAVMDGRRGASAAMALTTICFFPAAVAHWFHAVPTALAPPAPRMPVEVFIQNLGLNLAAFSVVTILAARMADQLQAASKRADEREQAFLELAALHEEVLESMDTGVVTTDLSGTILNVNPAAERLLGLGDAGPREPTDGPGTDETDLDGSRTQAVSSSGPNEKALWARFPELTPKPGIRRLSLRLPDGTARPLDVRVSELTDTQGRRRGWIFVLEDRTELERMEREKAEAERLAVLGRFASAIAHEIRNPLASISGSVELLGANLAGDQEGKRLQGIVLREVDRLEKLVSELLDYVRPSGRTEPAPLDWARELTEAVEMFRLDPRAKGRAIHLEAGEPVIVMADPARLRQLHLNLLANAADATPEGGTVHVRLEARPDEGVLTVRDQGSGVPSEIQEEIFEPFFSTKAKGTGLGLAICKKIAEEFFGEILVENHPDGGAVFSVRLPRANSRRADAPGTDTR